MIKTDVHHYDGKLVGIYKCTTQRTITDKILLIQKLYTHLKSPLARRATMMILTSLKTNPLDNIDHTNGIDATDVLCDLIQHPGIIDVWDIFEEQLGDIIGGSCPQGRADRLLQLLLTL